MKVRYVVSDNAPEDFHGFSLGSYEFDLSSDRSIEVVDDPSLQSALDEVPFLKRDSNFDAEAEAALANEIAVAAEAQRVAVQEQAARDAEAASSRPPETEEVEQ